MIQIIKNGIFKQNPTFVLLLGMCPTLATTTSLDSAVGMGLSATAVLICSNAVISLFRKIIPNQIRIAAFVVIIAGFVTIAELLLSAYMPELYGQLGIFIPLIVVNCIIFARAEEFAFRNRVIDSIMDAVGMGAGFTLALSVMAIFRELLGNGSLYGYELFGDAFQPATVMLLPPGGFLALGLILGVIQAISIRRRRRAE